MSGRAHCDFHVCTWVFVGRLCLPVGCSPWALLSPWAPGMTPSPPHGASFLFSGCPSCWRGAVRSLMQSIPSRWRLPCSRAVRQGEGFTGGIQLFSESFIFPLRTRPAPPPPCPHPSAALRTYIIFPALSVTSASCLLPLSKTQGGVAEKMRSQFALAAEISETLWG